MVENSNNNYKKRYNNNRKGNFRKFKGNAPMTKRGLFSFLFSFEGKISKNLFTGVSLLLAGVYCVAQLLSMLPAFQNNVYVEGVFSVINIIIGWAVVAVGYKRAHSLGISGIYSIVGTILFRPFFSFYRPERDFANDAMYKRRFDGFKKIGNFFDKNKFTQTIYILIMALVIAIPYAVVFANNWSEEMKDNLLFFILLIVFNILQLFVIEKRWVRKYYTNFVKVLSFISYNILVVSMAILVYSLSLMIKLSQIQAMQSIQ